MRQFLGSQTNRIDAKGRVSIPAGFRTLLRDANDNTALVLRPSSHFASIEGWPADVFHAMATPTDRLDPFDIAQQQRAARFYARAQEPQVDREGRMILPADLAKHAGITDEMTFIGHGRWFLIWEPKAGADYLASLEAAP